MNALNMTALDAATDAILWTRWQPDAMICHTPQPTPPADDDDDEDEEEKDRGSSGGNIDPDEDEGWSEEDDDDDDETLWSAPDARETRNRARY